MTSGNVASTFSPGTALLLIWINRALESLWLAAALLVPLAFIDPDYAVSEAVIAYVEVPKIALLRTVAGLLAILWSYARGGGLTKEGETAFDVIAYAAQIAAQLGAHIIKVKLSSDHLELEAARKVYEEYNIPRQALSDRVRHVVQSAFNGRRVVIFSGGAKKDDDEAVLDEARAIREGGGFGSIIGRNVFQRKKADALKLLDGIMEIYGN